MQTTIVLIVNYEGEQQGEEFIEPATQEAQTLSFLRDIVAQVPLTYDTGITVVSATSVSETGTFDLTQEE